MKNKKLLIAIDGPAGSGKSSTARALAKKIKVPFIDTGAMYRAVTLKAIREGVEFGDMKKLVHIARGADIRLVGNDPTKQRIILDGKDVTKAIREPELTKNVFHVAQAPMIRRELVKKQRALGKKLGGVMEGRDIGTVVFPNADFKFFFEANPDIRALRRQRELIAAGKDVPLAQVKKDMLRRDATDKNRREGPLRKAKDAHCLDTSSLTIEATIDRILEIIGSKPFKRTGLSRSKA
jgi:cytidylate kinase